MHKKLNKEFFLPLYNEISEKKSENKYKKRTFFTKSYSKCSNCHSLHFSIRYAFTHFIKFIKTCFGITKLTELIALFSWMLNQVLYNFQQTSYETIYSLVLNNSLFVDIHYIHHTWVKISFISKVKTYSDVWGL